MREQILEARTGKKAKAATKAKLVPAAKPAAVAGSAPRAPEVPAKSVPGQAAKPAEPAKPEAKPAPIPGVPAKAGTHAGSAAKPAPNPAAKSAAKPVSNPAAPANAGAPAKSAVKPASGGSTAKSAVKPASNPAVPAKAEALAKPAANPVAKPAEPAAPAPVVAPQPVSLTNILIFELSPETTPTQLFTLFNEPQHQPILFYCACAQLLAVTRELRVAEEHILLIAALFGLLKKEGLAPDTNPDEDCPEWEYFHDVFIPLRQLLGSEALLAHLSGTEEFEIPWAIRIITVCCPASRIRPRGVFPGGARRIRAPARGVAAPMVTHRAPRCGRLSSRPREARRMVIALSSGAGAAARA
ncbi:hypothetical protein B0H14DRAFT_2558776 [Mycena olivaceomarginata]|nr:hypothetical protein B0H14DRAFT_2558776 [Mycena olivaceomarginata]